MILPYELFLFLCLRNPVEVSQQTCHVGFCPEQVLYRSPRANSDVIETILELPECAVFLSRCLAEGDSEIQYWHSILCWSTIDSIIAFKNNFQRPNSFGDSGRVRVLI